MHSLATWWDVLKVAKEFNYFENDEIGEVESFLNDPMTWSADHGGAHLCLDNMFKWFSLILILSHCSKFIKNILEDAKFYHK